MAGQQFVTIFEDLNSSATVVSSVDWKFDHEYMVFIIEKDGTNELGISYTLTAAASLSSGDRGFITRHVDACVIFDQTDMKIKTQPRWGVQCPIIKVMERPIQYGTTDHTSEKWEVYWNGSPAQQVNLAWEDDYEYVAYSRLSYAPGSMPNRSFIWPSYVFAPLLLRDTGLSGDTAGYFRPHISSSGLLFYRGNSIPVSQRHIRMEGSNAQLVLVLRRKIRFDITPTTQFNSWKLTHSYNLPHGARSGDKNKFANPCPWPDNKECIIIGSDPRGSDEFGVAYYYTDLIALSTPQIDLREAGLTNDSSPDSRIEIYLPQYNGRGVKVVRTRGTSEPRVYGVWEKLETLDDTPIIVPPDPDPVPDCTQCIEEGTIWQQTTTLEAYFKDPADWMLRNYRYEWNFEPAGYVELIETREKGRIAVVRFIKQLEAADHEGSFDITATVTAFDVDYASIGLQDSDSAVITFQLPCVELPNEPVISIEDITVQELNNNHQIQITVSTDILVAGTPLTVDWETRDGTATSDLVVRALALDTNGQPFITIIETLDSSVRAYIDGAFPKFFNGFWSSKIEEPMYANTQSFTINLYNWLSGSKTGGTVLLLGDNVFASDSLYSFYDIKTLRGDPDGYSGFKNYFQEAADTTNRTLQTLYVDELNALSPDASYFDQYDCVVYLSSKYTNLQQFDLVTLNALKTANRNGLGLGVISDHGQDTEGEHGFYRGANELLNHLYGIKLKGLVDRDQMFLTVEGAIAQKGFHPLWTGMTGRINSNLSEAYVDAVDSTPDYLSAAGTITFDVGDQQKIIELTIIGDTIIESDEYFDVILSNNSRGSLGKAEGRVTIIDDDQVIINEPSISVQDISVVEQNSNHIMYARIVASEPVTGASLSVDWATRDGTATSDMSVRALAVDDLSLPFITIIQNIDSSIRMYIDGAFPKFYNMWFDQRGAAVKYMNTVYFTRNLINWLSGSKTGGTVLLMGDDVYEADSYYPFYDVKHFSTESNIGFREYFHEAATFTGRTLTVLYNEEIAQLPNLTGYFDQYDCVIYISSKLSSAQQNTPALIASLKTSHFNGLGVGVVGDHGVDNNPSGYGFYKGANEILLGLHGVNLQSSIDRDQMFLTVEAAIAANGNHPLWAGMSGQINSGATEAYVNATNSNPDYISNRGTVTFAIGQSEKLVPITIVGDTVTEPSEYFEVVLSNITRGTISDGVGRVTITDDDGNEIIPCGATAYAGGPGVTTNIHTLGNVAGNVTVNYDMFWVGDKLEIFVDNVRVAATSTDFSRPYGVNSGLYYGLAGGDRLNPTFVSGDGYISFYYSGSGVVTAVATGTPGFDTSWTYTLNCPVSTGSGGGGCFDPETLIIMADGSEKMIKDIVVGDEVYTVSIDGLPDSSGGDPEAYLDWYADVFAPEPSSAVVVALEHNTFHYYYEVMYEGSEIPLKVTTEHPVLVKRLGQWTFDSACYLQAGQKLFDRFNNEVSIISIKRIDQKLTTCNINVETLDTYFAGGVLVHNNDAPPTVKE